MDGLGLPDGVSLAFLPDFRGTDLRLTSRGLDAEAARTAFDAVEVEIGRRAGGHVYGRDREEVTGVIASLLVERNATLAVAESCTGQAVDCPHDDLAPTSTVCRGSEGVCDLVEYCNGASPACPNDEK